MVVADKGRVAQETAKTSASRLSFIFWPLRPWAESRNHKWSGAALFSSLVDHAAPHQLKNWRRNVQLFHHQQLHVPDHDTKSQWSTGGGQRSDQIHPKPNTTTSQHCRLNPVQSSASLGRIGALHASARTQ